jgi:uncharacterized DUF497 family protein
VIFCIVKKSGRVNFPLDFPTFCGYNKSEEKPVMYEFDSFEWDTEKQAITKHARNLDFADCWIVFSDENAVTLKSDRNDEERYKTIGELDGKLVAVIHMKRRKCARIISMRRAHKDEIGVYYEYKKI